MNAGVVIIDRDGVLNAESPNHIKSPAEWRPLPGSLEAIARLNTAGWRVAMATNQSGIARGLLSHDDFHAIQRLIDERLAALGGTIAPVLYSPDDRGSDSPMRKPRPGMLLEIAHRLDIDLTGVPFVGDARRDIEAARAVGAMPVLVRTGYGAQTLADGGELDGVTVHDDLAAFADAWLAVHGPQGER